MQIKILRTFADSFSFGELESDIENGSVKFSVFHAVEEAGSLNFTVGFDVALGVNETKQFNVKYVAEFESDEKVVPDAMREHSFFQVNAPAIAYPFLRAFVATVLVNAGYEPPMLPAVNFQELYRRRKAEK